MTGLIIATHGEMAKAVLEVSEILMGEQEKVEVIGFCPGDSLEILLERFKNAFDRLADCEDILITVDIKGGSPCNAATVMKAQHPNAHLVTGVNIPLLLQFFEDRYGETPIEESMQNIMEVGRTAINEITLI